MMMAQDGNDDLKGMCDREKIVVSMYYNFQCDKIIVVLGYQRE